jgi:para-aminobenzoate synthetase component I
MTLSEFESKLNEWGQQRAPFLFLIDFEMQKPLAWKLDQVPAEILFSVNEFSNVNSKSKQSVSIELKKYPIPFNEYQSKFEFVKNKISLGDSYLTNLTVKTKIELDKTLDELFHLTSAKYKVCWRNQFIVFSPETFIKIQAGQIFSFPMKGTIDASLPNAEQVILNDAKELSEHVTIVDLIRNDLSRVSTQVNVKRFRYIEKIKTNQKDLLQVSSEIVGTLSDNFYSNLGSIVVELLPAGSICGAPKKRTVEIIHEAERENRGYYTGIVGYFDGQNLDSGVMIRFIEQDQNHFYFRSGGGITSQSKLESEYQEVIDKIYVPLH